MAKKTNSHQQKEKHTETTSQQQIEKIFYITKVSLPFFEKEKMKQVRLEKCKQSVSEPPLHQWAAAQPINTSVEKQQHNTKKPSMLTQHGWFWRHWVSAPLQFRVATPNFPSSVCGGGESSGGNQSNQIEISVVTNCGQNVATSIFTARTHCVPTMQMSNVLPY